MSDFTDKVDDKRRKTIHYNTALESFKLELKHFEGNKKERILNLAKLKEETGCPKEEISTRVGDDLEGYLSKQYVRKILGDEYKDPKLVRNQELSVPLNVIEGATSSATDTAKRKLVITANGQTITQDPMCPEEENNPIDQIYGGKSHEQMMIEANKEIEEDKEEGVINHQKNITFTTSTLSDKPPTYQNLVAELAETREALREQKANADEKGKRLFDLKREFLRNSPVRLQEEIINLKVKINNLETLLADVDRNALKDIGGFKEVEIYKLVTERISWLLQVSKKSQRTIFLIINPKTMEVKEIKTDVEMHRIQARRAVGII